MKAHPGFDAVKNKITAEYRKKGMDKDKAHDIAEATANKMKKGK